MDAKTLCLIARHIKNEQSRQMGARLLRAMPQAARIREPCRSNFDGYGYLDAQESISDHEHKARQMKLIAQGFSPYGKPF